MNYLIKKLFNYTSNVLPHHSIEGLVKTHAIKKFLFVFLKNPK